MAKFTTALCILLVVCGAQGWTISIGVKTTSNSELLTTLEGYLTTFEAELKTLSTAFALVKNQTDAYLLNVTNSIKEWDAVWTEEYEELVAKAENASSCISLSVNYTEEASQIAANATTCANNILTELTTNYNAVVTDYNTFISNVNTTLTKAGNCGIFDLTCWATVVADAEELATSAITLEASAETLTESFENVGTEFEACDFESSYETLKNDWEEEYSKIEECIAEADSSA